MQTPVLPLWLLITLFALMLSGCYNSAFILDKNIEIPEASWSYDNKPAFEAAISDTVAQYNLYVNLRHTNNYPYSNMWLIIYTTLPSGKKMERRTELPLADKQGKWYGKDSGSIISQQVLIQSNAIMPEVGTYRFEFEQNMRTNPLTDVLSVGFAIEKAEKTAAIPAKQP